MADIPIETLLDMWYLRFGDAVVDIRDDDALEEAMWIYVNKKYPIAQRKGFAPYYNSIYHAPYGVSFLIGSVGLLKVRVFLKAEVT